MKQGRLSVMGAASYQHSASIGFWTPERREKGDVIVAEETMRAGVIRVRVAARPLPPANELDKDDERRPLLMYDAGVRQRTQFTIAGAEPNVIANYYGRRDRNIEVLSNDARRNYVMRCEPDR